MPKRNIVAGVAPDLDRTADPQVLAKELVSRIYGDMLREGCVVFLGAGSTTERDPDRRDTFYEKIKKISQFSGKRLSFPEMMQYFCDHKDGGHHNRLIREALSRIELSCIQGEEANHIATMFTQELAEIPYFKNFVTTNWDPFLERSLDVLVPTVEDRDLPFWDDHKRHVLKIHGCITRPYSIVATQSDYDSCMSQNPLVFNKMKDLMATKVFLFVGYSMNDPDFKKVWDLVNGSLGHFANLAYALDPNVSDEQVAFWRARGIEIFKASDLMFIRALRKKLEDDGLIPSERFLGFLQRERKRITTIHLTMGQSSDGRFISAMYQDGLLHELTSIISSTVLGTKKMADFERDHGERLKYLERMRRRKDPIEIAYCSGRVEILERFNKRLRSSIPTFFDPYLMHPSRRLVSGKKFGELSERKSFSKR